MDEIPPGYCQCGCGQETNLAPDSGRDYRGSGCYEYLYGHRARLQGRGPRWIKEDRGYKTACWIWQLSKTSRGYGRTKNGGTKMLMAHKVIWEVEHGPIPEGMQLHHKCEQPECVNLGHLAVVTARENMRLRKYNKLTMREARAIRAEAMRYPSGRRPKARLAREYGVSLGTIADIINGRTWADD